MPTKTVKLDLVPDSLALAVDAKKSIIDVFSDFENKMNQVAERCATITDPKEARKARLELVKIRTSSEAKRVEMKKEALTFTRALDGCQKTIEDAIRPLEEKMAEIELAEERRLAAIEAEKQEAIAKLHADRLALLTPYGIEIAPGTNYGTVEAEMFDAFLESVKKKHEAALKAADDLKQAQADAAEEERLRLEEQAKENDRLRLENEEKDRQLEAERAKAKADQDKKDAEAKKELQILEDKLAQEKAEREKLEKDAADREKARLDQLAKEKLAEKKKAAAPDRAKITDFIAALDTIPCAPLKTDEAKAILAEFNLAVDQASKILKQKASEL